MFIIPDHKGEYFYPIDKENHKASLKARPLNQPQFQPNYRETSAKERKFREFYVDNVVIGQKQPLVQNNLNISQITDKSVVKEDKS